MNAAILEDTTLSCMARFIMLWILRSPSEVINPEEIAETNHIPLKTVKSLLNELVDHKYLVKPQRVNSPAKAGQFTWTPYTLNPSHGQRSDGHPSDQKPEDGKVYDGEPFRAETPSAENPSMALADNGAVSTVEYTCAAGDKELLKELKESTEFEAINTKTNSLNSLNDIEPDATAQSAKTDAFHAELEAKSPELQADYKRALSEANRPERDDSSAPNPDAAKPLPPELEKAYLDKWGRFKISKYEREILHELIAARSLPVVMAEIEASRVLDYDDLPIKNPAAWIRTTGGKPISVTPAKKPDSFDPFNRDDEPEVLPEPEPIDPVWIDLGHVVKTHSTELYRTFEQCKFGGVKDGVLRVIAPTSRIFNDCYRGLRHQRWLYRRAEFLWEALQDVEFVLEGDTDAHPETG